MRRSRRALCGLVVLGALLGLGCPGARTGAGAPDGTARLEVRCAVPDATVWIDERLAGEIREVQGGIRVRAGEHRVEVRHDRYHTRYFEISLARGATRTLEVELVEVLD